MCGERRGVNGGFGQALTSAATPDGSRVFFSTEDKLAAGDLDGQERDVYEFSAGSTKLVSAPGGGFGSIENAYLMGCSSDGSRVFFGGDVPELWVGSGGTTEQVNVRESAGSADNAGISRLAISADGKTIAFETTEPLTTDDADTADFDVFERSDEDSNGTYDTKLVSELTGAESAGSVLAGISSDGSRIYFDSFDALTASDQNTTSDTYVRVNDTDPALLSIDPDTALAAGVSNFRGTTPDGEHVFFTTTTGIDPDDTGPPDADLYDRTDSATTWISEPDPGRPKGTFPSFTAASPDGALVYFSSDAGLKATDTDDSSDLYLRTSTGLVHISRQVAGADFSVVDGCSELAVIRGCASTDGSRIFFSTQERLLAADTDGNGDIYRFTAPSGPLQLVSGTGTNENGLGGVSENGTRAVFTTSDRLITCLDNDGDSDVYEWDNGVLNLVSPPLGTSQQGNVLSAISADASTVFFTSNAQYAGSGNDGTLLDLFASRPGGTAATCPALAKPITTKPLAKDVTAPKAALSGAKTQKAGKSVSVTVACDEACVASASGTVSVPGAAKVFKLGKAKKKSIRAGGKAKLKLKVSKKARRAIRKALRKKRKVRATIKLKIADTAGNTARPSRKIRLKR